jgi:transketolase
MAQEGHVPSAFSIVEILFAVYTLISKEGDSSKFVLSKGHASLALYAVLEDFDLIPRDWLDDYCNFDAKLGGHPDSTKSSFIECSTGSLGHGFPFAIGLALSKKIKGEVGNIFCLIGDGEANEGSVWESCLFASHHNLNNLTCFLDYNRSGDRAISLDNLQDKFRSFGWETEVVDGHDISHLSKRLLVEQKSPRMIISNTIKGFGLKDMENNPAWHHTKISKEKYVQFKDELERTE